MSLAIFSFKERKKPVWFNHADTEENNNKASKAFSSLMTVRGDTLNGAMMKNFTKRVAQVAQELNYTEYPYPHLGKNELLSVTEASFYDAVFLYGIALNKTLGNDISVYGKMTMIGNDVARAMRNVIFEGKFNSLYTSGQANLDAEKFWICIL